ncbi:MAG: nuclear transport factor 2 family protein [Acidobacteriaceae bacterium]|nr:nuclear transport factor 2 family protein [Acidobacteriaceae bacterium]
MTRLSLWFALSVGITGLLAAQAPSASGSAEKEVMAVEQARTTALERSDIAALDRIMADDVTYVHASGKVDTKESYLSAIRSGQLHYISWQPRDLHVRIVGDSAAVIDGEYTVRVTDSRVQPSPFDINLFILTVYARRNGNWQQIAWQSTRNVAASPSK